MVYNFQVFNPLKNKVIIFQVIILAILFLPQISLAANNYIRDGGIGDCSDWTNACDVLPTTLTRGDTYYIADGTYTSYTFDDANSGATLIIIKKATVADHGTATGWVDSYGDGQAVFGGAHFQGDANSAGYYMIDGVTGGGPESWESGHGIKITDSITFEKYVDNNSDYITFSHIEVDLGATGPNNTRGMEAYAADYLTIEYSYFHDVGCDMLSFNVINNLTIQYSKFARNHQAEPGCHGDFLEYQIGDGSNFIIRYNFFEDIVGSYMFGSHGPLINGYEIYGNIFHWTITPYFGNGIVGCLSGGGTISNLKFYNNTLSGGFDGIMGFGLLRGSDNVAYNNIWHRTIGLSYSLGFSNAAHSNNTFFNTTIVSGEENLTGDPFINRSGRDYRLSTASSLGTALSSPYNTDMDGNTRGSDGTWDRGAYEYVTSGSTNWYVRPNGGIYGSENGADWSNAFDGFSDIAWSSVSCGDTIWIAGGNYTQSLNLQKKCTSGSRLYIRRARSDSSESTGVLGWSAGFDSTITQARAGIVVNGDIDYITVSGRTTESGGSYGWHINFSGDTSGAGIEFINGTDGDYNIFEYMDIQGPGYATYSADGRGLDITPFASPNLSTGNIFSHMKIWNWESGAYNVWADGSIFEYIEMYNLMAENWQSWHPNGIYISNSSNGIIRYSNFHKETYAIGEGIFFEQSGGSSNWQIYGNIFYDLDDSAYKAIEIQSVVPNLKIFNNTFDNVVNVTYGGSTYCGSGSEFRNNLQYYSSGGTCGTNSNNLTLTSLDPFINRAGHDYHIVSTTGAGYPRNNGTNLAVYFTTDREGVIFGSDGSWDIGAYEYIASGPLPDITPPSAPTGLVAQ